MKYDEEIEMLKDAINDTLNIISANPRMPNDLRHITFEIILPHIIDAKYEEVDEEKHED